jgi:alpha-tubulin suppressor-like RCC1 family protein
MRSLHFSGFATLGATFALLTSCGGDGGGPPSAPPPVRVLFVGQPTTGSWGVAFPDQPVVAILDQDGAVVDTVERPVTLSLIGGTDVVLVGSKTLAAVAGQATFSALSADRPGTGLRLIATAVGLAPDTTEAFDVGGPLPHHLTFTSAPVAGSGGTVFADQPVVEVRTATEQLVPWFSGDVTVTRTSTSPSGTLLGTTARPVVNGVATFTDLALDTAGAGYALVAAAAGVAPDTSAAFTVTIGHMTAAKSSFLPDATTLFPDDSVGFLLTARDAGGNPIEGATGLLAVARVTGTSDGTFGAFQDIGGGAYRAYLSATAFGSATTWRVLHDGQAGPTSPAVTVVGVASVSAGEAHTCATLTTGALYCWGASGQGRLGLGAMGDTAAPVRVGSATDWGAPRAGWEHTCALRPSGVWCWGDNSWGQLVTGDNTPHDEPFFVSGSSGVTQVATGLGWTSGSVITDGGYNSCVRRADGRAWCAGDNRYGEIGDGTNGFLKESDTLKAVTGAVVMVDLAVGAGTVCGLANGGTGFCWGDNAVNQLGRGDQIGDATCADGAGACRTAPSSIAGGRAYVAGSLDAGVNLFCAISGTRPYCWGAQPTVLGTFSYPVATEIVPLDVQRVAVGSEFTCLLGVGGLAGCRGSNDLGQLGDGTTTSRAGFVDLSGGRGYVGLDAGGRHACAIQAVTRALYCWGDNSSGQVGDGTRTARLAPVRIRFTL